MSHRLIIRAEAETDITEAALWYDKCEAGLGLELTVEIHAAIRRALGNPAGYLRLRKRPEVRRILSRRFPYRIFYIVRPDAMIVFAVIHVARRERHWKRRLR
jgi:toxin ParE1/3/4